MKINPLAELHTLYGEVMKRPPLPFDKTDDKEVPMTLGFMVVEALPKSLAENAGQNEKLKVVELQRRIIRGETEFTAEEVVTMRAGLFKYVAPEFSFLAQEAWGLLEG